MKITLTIFLIIGFAGVAVFGVFAMGHGSGHGHSDCIAATANGLPCPKNSFQFLTFHLGAFRSFSTAIFGNNLASALLLFIAALTAAIGIFARINPAPPAFAKNYHCRQFLESRSFSFQQELINWLARHENSPTV